MSSAGVEILLGIEQIIAQLKVELDPLLMENGGPFKCIESWDLDDLTANMGPGRCPLLNLESAGEPYSLPGPATDSIWRHYAVMCRIFASYTTSAAERVNPASADTRGQLSQQLRDRIIQIPRLDIETGRLELVPWKPAQDGKWVGDNSIGYSYRQLIVEWRVWEDWDGGGNPVAGIYSGTNGNP